MGKVLVVGEQKNGKLKGNAGELVAAARILGDPVRGAVLGPGADQAAPQFGLYGVDTVRALETEVRYSSDAFAAALAPVVTECEVQYVVLMQSFFGRDLGARLAAKLNAGWIDDVTTLEVADGTVVGSKPLFAGKVISKVAFVGDGPHVITLRAKNFTPVEATDGVQVEVKPLEMPAEVKAQVTGLEAKDESQIDLKEADIIITGGRGVNGPEGFAPLREFAKMVGAALGASRAAVDADWIEHSHQVGQTGKVVNPQLYIACGVSGAIQHLAGMQTSKVIVAINSNEGAPIFKIADYGIVGDLFEVVPELQKQLLAAKE